MTDVPFSVAAELQPCRLLELPPELLEFIASGTHSLEFKAPDASDSESFLCTQHKTYHLRQVHTSNSVYLTTPSSSNASALTAVSQCGSVLEALPAPNHHAKSILSSLLTPFTDPQHLEAGAALSQTKEYIFAHTPMSRGECQSVWEDLVAFEHATSPTTPAQSYRPTAAALVKAWKWLLELAHIHSLNLAHRPLARQALDAVLQEEDEWPTQLVEAIFLKLMQDKESSPYLGKDAAVPWVGRNILEARQQDPSEQSSIEKMVFLEAWRNALPEDWRDQVALDLLGNSYKLSGGSRTIEFASEHIIQAEKEAKGVPKGTAAATAGKRKWHEKFAAARKQGKPS